MCRKGVSAHLWVWALLEDYLLPFFPSHGVDVPMCGSAGGHHVSPACVPRLQVGPEDEGACCAIGSGGQGAGGAIISVERPHPSENSCLFKCSASILHSFNVPGYLRDCSEVADLKSDNTPWKICFNWISNIVWFFWIPDRDETLIVSVCCNANTSKGLFLYMESPG